MVYLPPGSVCGVRLISEREIQRLNFKKANYWGVFAKNKKEDQSFESRLWSYGGRRVAMGKDFDPRTGKPADSKKAKFCGWMSLWQRK